MESLLEVQKYTMKILLFYVSHLPSYFIQWQSMISSFCVSF